MAADILPKILDSLTLAVTTFISAMAAIKVAQISNAKKLKAIESEEEVFDLHDEITPQIKEICQYIGETVGALRCDYWVGHNGQKSISGFHMTKISMQAEWVSPEAIETIHISQNLPTFTFERNMTALSKSKDHYIVSHEFQKKDMLATLLKSFGVSTFVSFKTFGSRGAWEGLVTLGFDKEKNLTPTQIAQIHMQVDRISAIVSHSN